MLRKLASAATLVAIAALGSSAIAQTASAPASATSAPARVQPPAPTPAAKDASAPGDAMSGTAAWYGKKFNGRKTASGSRFNAGAMTAAHPTLPFGSRVKVTNTKDKRSVVVVINDRGPTTPGRILDVSQAAASRLGFIRQGTVEVSLELLGQTKRVTRKGM